jgi:hypothetical protein
MTNMLGRDDQGLVDINAFRVPHPADHVDFESRIAPALAG